MRSHRLLWTVLIFGASLILFSVPQARVGIAYAASAPTCQALSIAGLAPVPGDCYAATIPGNLTPCPDPSPDGSKIPVAVTVIMNPHPLAAPVASAANVPTTLDAFALAVANPQSPYYRHFLAPSQLATLYAPSATQYDNFMAAMGCSNGVRCIASNDRLTLTIIGSIADIQRLFSVRYEYYSLTYPDALASAVNPAVVSHPEPSVVCPNGPFSTSPLDDIYGRSRFIYITQDAPQVHASFASLVAGVVGLDNMSMMHPSARAMATPGPEDTPGRTIDDFWDAYGFGGLPAGTPLRSAFTPSSAIYLIEYTNQQSLTTLLPAGAAAWRDEPITTGPIPVPGSAMTPTGAATVAPTPVTPAAAPMATPIDPRAILADDEIFGDAATLSRFASVGDIHILRSCLEGCAAIPPQAMFDLAISGSTGSSHTVPAVVANAWYLCGWDDDVEESTMQEILALAAAAGVSALNADGSRDLCYDTPTLPSESYLPGSATGSITVGATDLKLDPAAHQWKDEVTYVMPQQTGIAVGYYWSTVGAQARAETGPVVCRAVVASCIRYGGTAFATMVWAAAVQRTSSYLDVPLGYFPSWLTAVGAQANFPGLHEVSRGSDGSNVGFGSIDLGRFVSTYVPLATEVHYEIVSTSATNSLGAAPAIVPAAAASTTPKPAGFALQLTLKGSGFGPDTVVQQSHAGCEGDANAIAIADPYLALFPDWVVGATSPAHPYSISSLPLAPNWFDLLQYPTPSSDLAFFKNWTDSSIVVCGITSSLGTPIDLTGIDPSTDATLYVTVRNTASGFARTSYATLPPQLIYSSDGIVGPNAVRELGIFTLTGHLFSCSGMTSDCALRYAPVQFRIGPDYATTAFSDANGEYSQAFQAPNVSDAVASNGSGVKTLQFTVGLGNFSPNVSKSVAIICEAGTPLSPAPEATVSPPVKTISFSVAPEIASSPQPTILIDAVSRDGTTVATPAPATLAAPVSGNGPWTATAAFVPPLTHSGVYTTHVYFVDSNSSGPECKEQILGRFTIAP
jgi:Pro-kumamolisin, activation domain